MNVEEVLRGYKQKKAEMLVLAARIEQQQNALDSNKEIEFEYYKPDLLGMPRAHNNTSPVEIEVMSKEKAIEEWREALKFRVQKDKSIYNGLKYQIDVIESALTALTEQELELITLRYFEKWGMPNLCDRYRLHKKAVSERLAKVRNVLCTVLSPYYRG